MSQNINLDKFEENLNISWGKVIARQDNMKFTCPKEWWQSPDGQPLEIYFGESPGWAMGLERRYKFDVDVILYSAAWIVTHAYDFLGEPFFYDNRIGSEDIPVPERIKEIEKWIYTIAEKSDKVVFLDMANDIINAYNDHMSRITPEDVKTQSKPETQS